MLWQGEKHFMYCKDHSRNAVLKSEILAAAHNKTNNNNNNLISLVLGIVSVSPPS